MAQVSDSSPAVWTAVDLVQRFGPIPLSRVRTTPPPGSATEQDVIAIHDRENRLCELLDGTLMEKTMGNYESYLAGVLVRLLGDFVAEKNLGIILPPDGMHAAGSRTCAPSRRIVRLMETAAGTPCSARWNLEAGAPIWPSRSSAKAIPARRWSESSSIISRLACGWCGTFTQRRARRGSTWLPISTSPSAEGVLDGGDVLPGFRLSLETLFAQPGESL